MTRREEQGRAGLLVGCLLREPPKQHLSQLQAEGHDALFGALPEDHQGQVIEIHPLASNSEGFVDPNAGIQQ